MHNQLKGEPEGRAESAAETKDPVCDQYGFGTTPERPVVSVSPECKVDRDRDDIPQLTECPTCHKPYVHIPGIFRPARSCNCPAAQPVAADLTKVEEIAQQLVVLTNRSAGSNDFHWTKEDFMPILRPFITQVRQPPESGTDLARWIWCRFVGIPITEPYDKEFRLLLLKIASYTDEIKQRELFAPVIPVGQKENK